MRRSQSRFLLRRKDRISPTRDFGRKGLLTHDGISFLTVAGFLVGGDWMTVCGENYAFVGNAEGMDDDDKKNTRKGQSCL